MDAIRFTSSQPRAKPVALPAHLTVLPGPAGGSTALALEERLASLGRSRALLVAWQFAQGRHFRDTS